jgi:MYXO-CTERM domain-containing protein
MAAMRTMARSSIAIGLVTFAPSAALAATLQVGPGRAYTLPCQAFAAAASGDVVEIDAAGNGTYDGDVCAVTVSRLTIRGVDGRAAIDAAGQNAQGKGIWGVQGDDITIENVELSGATVPDQNGAGIRQEGTNLTLRNCYFHDNENGILAGANLDSEILIESCEFARNGFGDGYTHNMYIGNIKKFTLRYSYSHSALIGHLVKSRANENYILYNRLTGESDGTESYEINLPNAGTSYVIGNLIQQGPNTDNSAMLDYGSEGASNPGNDLYVVNNTFVNDRSGGGTFVSISNATVPAVVTNNIFSGPGTAVSQATAIQSHNLVGASPRLVDAAGFDYRLAPGSPCIDAGVDPGAAASGFSLLPVAQYVHPAGAEGRTTAGVIDIGAYEVGGGTAGAPGTGGASAVGGAAGAPATGGVPATGGTTAAAGADATGGSSDESSGCGCAVPARSHGSAPVLALLAGLLLRRRRSDRTQKGQRA